MSLPRQIIPGRTYLVTRRCAQRQLLLRPSPLVNRIFLYCLAVAAHRHGILVHAYCALSNHWHVVVTDPHGKLPEFVHWLDLYVAKCINAALGRWESVWSSGSYSAVHLVGLDDVLAKAAYTLANPVAAGLVAEGWQWPGARGGTEGRGQRVSVRRPHVFFRAGTSLPTEAVLEIAEPPGWEAEQRDPFCRAVTHAVEALEQQSRATLSAEGRSFLGRRQVLAQSPHEVPRTREARRALRPRVACKDKWRRIETLSRLKEFVRAYREAWRQWRAGVREVLFPAGTYALHLHAGVRVVEMT